MAGHQWGNIVKNELRMTREEIEAFLDVEFPQARGAKPWFVVEEVTPMRARVRVFYHEKQLRPGGTISGPTMMALADIAAYVVVLAHAGPKALAVTTSLNINFLRKPTRRDLIADAELVKLGQRLAVTDVRLRSDGTDEPVAQAAVTYSIPPR